MRVPCVKYTPAVFPLPSWAAKGGGSNDGAWTTGAGYASESPFQGYIIVGADGSLPALGGKWDINL